MSDRSASAYDPTETAPVLVTGALVTVPPSASNTSAEWSTEECSTADTIR